MERGSAHLALRKLVPHSGESIPRRANLQSSVDSYLWIIEEVAPDECDQVMPAGPPSCDHNGHICRMCPDALMSTHISCRCVPHDLQPRSAQRLPVVR